jgi:hypothetical protein
MYNIGLFETFSVSLKAVFSALIGAIFALTIGILNFVYTFRAYRQPTCYGDVFCVRPTSGVFLASVALAIMGILICILLILWVIKVYPLLKYPTFAERYYHLIFEKGQPTKGQVERIKVVNEEKTCIYYTYGKYQKKGKYYSSSPIAKTLKQDDFVVVCYDGDHSVLL